jgi:D-alanine-D-alanine ligase
VLFNLDESSPKMTNAQPPPPEETAPTRGAPRHVPSSDQRIPRAPHAVAVALANQGFSVSVVNMENDVTRLHDALAVEFPDIVFNLVSEVDGDTTLHPQVAAYLDLVGQPYTGGDSSALGSCINRVRARLMLRDAGVPLPRFATVRDVNAVPDTTEFSPPVTVTQAYDDLYETEGTENPVYSWEDAVERVAALAPHFDMPYLIEEYISHRRVSVVVLGNRTLECLPITEAELPDPPSPDPDAEETEGTPGEEEEPTLARKAVAEAAAEAARLPTVTPLELGVIYLAQLDNDSADRIRALALKAFRVMGCRDYARVDFHLDADEKAYLVDVRSMLELGPGNSFALAAEATDRGYDGTIAEIARIACRRAGMPEAALMSEQSTMDDAAPEHLDASELATDDVEVPADEESDDDESGETTSPGVVP